MKKLLSLVTFVMCIVCFSSCDKENATDVLPVNSAKGYTNIDISYLYNKDNPFDTYSYDLFTAFQKLDSLLNDPVIAVSSYNHFDSVFNSVLTASYPAIDTTGFSSTESSLLESFCEALDDINEAKDIKSISLTYENMVLQNTTLTSSQKLRDLSIISQTKYSLYYSMNWEDRFDGCIRSTLANTFADDGNPIPETIFIAGLPGSMLEVAAACAWEATFSATKSK